MFEVKQLSIIVRKEELGRLYSVLSREITHFVLKGHIRKKWIGKEVVFGQANFGNLVI